MKFAFDNYIPLTLKNGRNVNVPIPDDATSVTYRHLVSLPMRYYYDEFGNRHEEPDRSQDVLVYDDEYEVI